MNDVVAAHVSRFVEAFGYPFTSTRRTLATLAFAAGTYVLLILSSFPTYSVQMLTADPGYLDDAVLALTANTFESIGAVGLGLTVVYAAVTGIALTTALGRLGHAGRGSARGLSSILPGLLASGCASCGAGLLGTLGFVGALSTLPFDGDLLRLLGLVFLVAYLSRLGDPRSCAMPSGAGGE